MKANPGGHIDPAETFGRDEIIASLWRILERRSLILSAERRMGKTCIIKKMSAESPQEMLIVYRDLEGVRTPVEFAEIVFHDVEDYLSRSRRTAVRARQWLSHLAGAEIGSIIKFPDAAASHWKSLLTKIIEDLIEHQDRLVIFFWDEMPLMLYNIKKQNGEEAAMEILDALRSLRQMHPNLRMGFTGSIGLHNVITSLRRAGYANDPTNDMTTVDVPPLLPDDAKELARRLLEGEKVPTNNLETTTSAIATAVDCMPHYIHHIVDQIAQRRLTANEAIIDEIVDSCLTNSQDPWHLRYYRERIDTYYETDECRFGLKLLDVLSVSDQAKLFDELFNLLKAGLVTEDREMAHHVLTLLQRDHYVEQQKSGAFGFRSRLIQRWWRLHRGIG